jgi:hypothetical protein
MGGAIVTVEQTAEKFQMHVSTVRRMLRSQPVPGMKLGPKQLPMLSDAAAGEQEPT